MRLKIERRIFADGVEREMLMYRDHWWENWKPFHSSGQIAYVSYLGKSCWSLQDECFDRQGLDEQQRKARETMLRYILNAEEVYIGARIEGDCYVGYDVADDDSMDVLRNLEE